MEALHAVWPVWVLMQNNSFADVRPKSRPSLTTGVLNWTEMRGLSQRTFPVKPSAVFSILTAWVPRLPPL